MRVHRESTRAVSGTGIGAGTGALGASRHTSVSALSSEHSSAFGSRERLASSPAPAGATSTTTARLSRGLSPAAENRSRESREVGLVIHSAVLSKFYYQSEYETHPLF